MRVAVVVGLVALLCGAVDAAPKAKERKGTFAAYIDPAAPDDPPRPPPPPEPRTSPLSIVVLVDRSTGTAGAKLDRATEAILEIALTAWDDDRIAVLAFDDSVDYVLRPKCAGDPRILQAAFKLEPASGPANLAGALAEARSYMARAPNRKVIVLVTDGATPSDELDDAMRSVRDANIETIVIGVRDTDDDILTYIEQGTAARARFVFASRGEHVDFAQVIYDLHYLDRDSKPSSARWTIGSARSTSPPPP